MNITMSDMSLRTRLLLKYGRQVTVMSFEYFILIFCQIKVVLRHLRPHPHTRKNLCGHFSCITHCNVCSSSGEFEKFTSPATNFSLTLLHYPAMHENYSAIVNRLFIDVSASSRRCHFMSSSFHFTITSFP